MEIKDRIREALELAEAFFSTEDISEANIRIVTITVTDISIEEDGYFEIRIEKPSNTLIINGNRVDEPIDEDDLEPVITDIVENMLEQIKNNSSITLKTITYLGE